MLAILLLVLGVALLAAGIAFVFWPAALIAAGVGLVSIALLADFDRKESK